MKIIHCADLHLGSKIESKLMKISSDRKTEVRNSFSKLVDYAEKNEISIILLSGDVFDSDKPLKKDKEFFYNVIKENPNIDFIYLRGNHDSYELYNENISNLKTFDNSWKCYQYGYICISGIEISKDNYASLYSTLNLDVNNINIVMLHGQISESIGIDKIKLAKLRNKNIDYLALGHVHSYQKDKLDDRGIYAYSGCLEGRGFDETGPKGFIVLNIENKKIIPEFINFCCRTINEVEIDISNHKTISEINKNIISKLKSKNDIYRIILVGDISYDLEINNYDIKSYLNDYYFIDVKNKTRRKIDISKYQNDLSLKGEFVRSVYYRNDLTNQEKEDIISLGLRTMEGREVDL